MRLITWNSNMAFRKKYKSIMQYDPDIVIIQECENLEKIDFVEIKRPLIDSIWVGDNEFKGIGIFSFSNKISIADFYNPEFRYIIPFKVDDYYILAVWAMDDKENHENRYIAQVWLAINYYENILHKNRIIIIGDFNSNKIWDKKKRIANHSNVVKYLDKFKICSVYHRVNNEEQGKESLNTFFMHRNENKGYHIDYCFLSYELLDKIVSFEIGKYNDWKGLSDHCPIILDLDK